MKTITPSSIIASANQTAKGNGSWLSSLKLLLLMMIFVSFSNQEAKGQAAPACNIDGPLKACLFGGNMNITVQIEFATADPELVYSFPVNTTGAFIVSTGAYNYDPFTGAGTQALVINPGTTYGPINLQLNVKTDFGQCECSKSITIVSTTVALSATPILCYDGTSTITANAGGSGSANYKYTLNPGNVVKGFTPSTSVTFPDLSAGTYTVEILGSNGCSHKDTIEITEPPYNPVVINCPVDTTLPSCKTQTAIDADFAAWLATFSYSGGTNPVLTTTPTTPVAPKACGGSVDVTWTVTSDCEPFLSTCTKTFSVTPADELIVNKPSDSNSSSCDYADQAALNSAFASWLAGFTKSGGCSPNGSFADGIPTAPLLCAGGVVNATYNVTDQCDTISVSASFTLNKPSDLVVNKPSDSNTNACSYANQAAVDAAFASWLTGFTKSGGCNPNGSYGTPSAPKLCDGGTTNVTYIVTDLCDTVSVSASFTINKPADLVVNKPSDSNTNACDYANQTAVNNAFASWLTGFTKSGGCNPQGSYGTPTAPKLCDGGTTNVTYNVTDLCDTVSVSASFTINKPADLVVNKPGDANNDACDYADQAAVNAAFASWLTGFTKSGGCNPQGSYGTPSAPKLCDGGTTNVTYNVTDLCDTVSVSASFTINKPSALVLTCPKDTTEDAGQTQAAIDAKFAAWLASVSYSGGCNPQISNNSTNAPDSCGGSVTVKFTLTDLCETKECSATFKVDNAGSIGDFVWEDYNNNGIQDAGEPGLAGITVTLSGTHSDVATTDANGHYLFSCLPHGTYTVTFGSPGGTYVPSPSNQGGDDAKDSDPVGGVVSGIVLSVGENDLTIDAGFFNPACLGDFVWEDYNNNGIQDAGEPGIAGVTVTLTLPGGGTKVTTTDANGAYSFCDLPKGDYCVSFATPSGGYKPSAANQGGDDAADSDPVAGQVCGINLSPGERDSTIDAGFFNPACLGNFVWDDKNKNGIQDAGEPGIAGVTVKVILPSGDSLTTTTDANGFYEFCNLIPGSYCVKFTTPSGGYVPTEADQGGDDEKDSDPVDGKVCGINLTPGKKDYTIDGGFYSPFGSIGDFVWNDLNKNGTQDPGEPGISGVCVTLTGPSLGAPVVVTTDASGKYLFPNLAAGDYCVAFCGVSGFDLTTSNGAADDKDSDPTNIGLPVCITLGSGENNMTIDAGFVATDCWEPCDGDPRVGAVQSVSTNVVDSTIVIKVTFNKTFADNTYGTNAIGWPNGHTFGNLTGSDHLRMALFDKNGVNRLEFKMDYITADATKPSGYGTLGVSGGEGTMIVGSASNVVKVRTSLSENFNSFGYVLPVNSPATDANYTPNPSFPNWDYSIWYEATIKLSAFGPAGFDSIGITGIHASPSKIGTNTACVQPCRPLSASVSASNGPCKTTCKGTAGVSAKHGKTPYAYAWVASNGGTVPTGQENLSALTNLCAGTYTVTVTDGLGTQVVAQATVAAADTVCPPEICYESCTANPAVGATQTVTDNGSTVTIRTKFARTFVDNTYGTGAIGWTKGHTFGNLTGSDHLQLALYDANNVKAMEFKVDYLTAATAPSGYKCLGVTGGEGKMILGNASDVVGAVTSLDENFNKFGYVLTTNSPSTDANYTPNPTYPNWIYDVWYEVTVNKSAFGSAGFGKPVITSVHASPSKTGNNTECVQLCMPLSASAVVATGPCGTTCKGIVNLTASHGKAPYSYSWTGPLGFTSTSEDLQNVCAGTYNVTVTDGEGTTATAQAVVVEPSQTNCAESICFEGEKYPNEVKANTTWSIDPIAKTVTIRTTLSKSFVDNTYGKNSIGWNDCDKNKKGEHKFNDLVGSDNLEMTLFDAKNKKRLEFELDYISASKSAPSGYKSLGVKGGDGKMKTGKASNVLNVVTSLDKNLNTFGYVLTKESPATDANYTPNPTYPNWIYEVWYEVTVKLDAFGTAGFGKPVVEKAHASPSKVCKNYDKMIIVPCVPPRLASNEESAPARIAEDQDPMQFRLFPNPTSGDVNITYVSEEGTEARVNLFDVTGKIIGVKYRGTSSGRVHEVRFDASELPTGIYMVQLVTGNQVVNKKLIIQR